MEEKKGCTVINQYFGCCGKGADNGTGSDSIPVGTVISYMGMKAPKHYLTCDGAIYDIDNYKEISDFIKEEYGTFDFFGGDGITTFAVPDLRNEFLRGHHGDKEEKLSGEIGVHQDGTGHLFTYNGRTSKLCFNADFNTPTDQFPSNVDNRIYSTNKTGWLVDATTQNWAGSGIAKYTSRPTNTTVLYCIKYE